MFTREGHTPKYEDNTRPYNLLDSFVEYCACHPEERFWQALRNWSGHPFIYGSNHALPPEEGLYDTFFSNEINKLIAK